ncbi:MAG: LTA synthase family protein [Firmicutes bacterium]|nr:LTA synthase family protein [Bacillota bacterium]
MDTLKKIGNGLISAGILLSTVLFYHWFVPELNVIVSIAGTIFFLTALFFGHRRTYISCMIFTAISVLMFANIIFNAYYSGYLTLELLGSAKFLGDVTDVIVLLIRPQYFVIFLGPVLAWTGAVILRRTAATASGEASSATPVFHKYRRTFGTAGLILLALVVLNPLQFSYIQSVGSTEMISYHLKDILKHTIGYGVVSYDAEFEMDYQASESDPLFGIAEGKNLIVIQAEALQDFVIGEEYNGQELTPVLNELLKENTIHFDNYYMQIAAGNTSDAEFATNNSIYGTGQSYTYEIYKNNAFRGLPWLLMERGYSTIAMHGYEGQFWSRDVAYETQGFETFVDKDGFRRYGTETAWGINDEDFFRQAVKYMKDQEEPFYSFLVTLSNHTPFELPEQLSTLELKEEHVGTLFGNYLRSVHYADKALEVLIEQLKNEGLYENTVIALYGDHFGLSVSDEANVNHMSEFLGREYKFSDAANVPLIIHIPGAEGLPETVSVAGGQTDFLPTMAYLMGFDELDTLYMGQNLLETGQEGYVIQYRYAQPGTFITNEYCYNASTDGIFTNGKAYTLENGERMKLTEDMRELFHRSLGLAQKVHEVLDDDVIRQLYYADGKADRVETKLVELPKAPVTTPVKPPSPAPEVIPEPVLPPDLVTTGPAVTLPEGEMNVEQNDSGNSSQSVI